MKKTVKFLSFILSMVVITSALCGCSDKRKEGYPPIWTSDDRVVMTVGGYNVTYDFYRYLFLNTKAYYDNGDETYWQQEGNDVEKVKDYVVDSIKWTYGMFELADKYEVTLSDTDLEQIKSYMESSKQGYTDEQYKAEIEAAFLTDELYEYVLKIQQLEYLVYQHIISENSGILKIDDETLLNAIETDFVRATHILFSFETDEEKSTQLDEANKILERLKNGEDFETLKDEYSDDTDLKGNTDGYYFTHGEFGNEFEDTAFALKEGEISEVVTSSIGHHIVKRMPIDDNYVKENLETLRTQYATAKYYEMLENTYKDYTAEYTEEYKNIQLDSFN